MKTPAALALFLGLAAAATAGPFEDGVAAYELGDYRRAFSLLQPLAREGNAAAQLRLGQLYYYGSGVKEDEHLAVDWLRKSAAQGNTEAMYQLGNAFTFGNDTPKMASDPDVEAARWYFQAAQAGHREAQYALGLMFLAGKGVEQSQEQAFAWIRKAASQGHPEARSFISGLDAKK